jgi:glucose uptake protein GlcU
MNAITMVRTAVTLLALGALGGVVMATIRLSRNTNPPSWLAMLHGLLVSAAATLLLYATFTAGIPRAANLGLALLVLAALGGLVLNLNFHSKNLLLPRGLMVGHALLAVVGFLLVLLTAWTGW